MVSPGRRKQFEKFKNQKLKQQGRYSKLQVLGPAAKELFFLPLKKGGNLIITRLPKSKQSSIKNK